MGPERDGVHVVLVAHGRVAQLEQAQAVFPGGQHVDAHLGAVFAGQAGAEDRPALGRHGVAVEAVQRVAHGLQPLRRALRRGHRVGVRERGAQGHVQACGGRQLLCIRCGRRRAALQLAARQPEAAFATAPAAQVVVVEGRGKNHGHYQTKPTQDRTGTGTKATGASSQSAPARGDASV
ncbi:hypothetical protein FQZ97_901960 [compost metagenome]